MKTINEKPAVAINHALRGRLERVMGSVKTESVSAKDFLGVPESEKAPIFPEDKTILRHLYDNRKKFNVLAITGPLGCEEDYFEKIISSDFREWKNLVREPQDLPITLPGEEADISEHSIIKQIAFKQKYTICYNYWQQHNAKYTILSYNKMALFYTLAWIARKCEKLNYRAAIIENLSDIISKTKFGKDYLEEKNTERAQEMMSATFTQVLNEMGDVDYNALFDLSKKIGSILEPFELADSAKTDLADEFLRDDSIVAKFYDKFCVQLEAKDYFIYHFLWYRLGCNIRMYGSPLKEDDGKDTQGEHLFNLIELINIVIKKAPHDQPRLFCVSYLRNSLEIRYLSERYNAFYPIALHNLKCIKEVISEEVEKNTSKDKEQKERIKKYTFDLSRTEVELNNYREGDFASPDVEQCVSRAEIHIRIQPSNKDKEISEFYSTEEQWMKFASLMFHPGIITPSSDERCMEVAYTARLNSSCVSRQVGAVITNKAHSIRSIGWNEVPYGQMPCGLRNMSDIVKNDFDREKGYMYSEFEKGNSNQTDIYKDGQTFQQKISEDYGKIIEQMAERLHSNRPIFCFRELHNRYAGGNNQVYGRSLHAEENALMQISKFGGEGLMDGVIYVTASPCELCSRKLYQVGVRKIVYIDPYPGIAREQTVASGFLRPELVQYRGAYGASFFKLFTPLIAPKDEQSIRCKDLSCGLVPKKSVLNLIQGVLKEIGCDIDITKNATFSQSEIEELKLKLQQLTKSPTMPADQKKTILALITIVKRINVNVLI